MPETRTEEFKTALDTCKQLLTLATGVLTITITFMKEIVKPAQVDAQWLVWGWYMFVLSIFGGVMMMLAITGSLASPADPARTIYAANVRVPAFIQVGAFFLGMAFTVLFARATF